MSNEVQVLKTITRSDGSVSEQQFVVESFPDFVVGYIKFNQGLGFRDAINATANEMQVKKGNITVVYSPL